MNDILRTKLADMDVPGYGVELEPHEAEELGFCVDDAMSLEDALAAAQDTIEEE